MQRIPKNLKPWPNGMGYDYKGWQIVRVEDKWTASYTPKGEQYATKVGIGDNWFDAILHAEKID